MGIPELNLIPPEHVNPAGKLQLLEHREELIGVLESGLLDRRHEESLAHQKWCPTSTARNCDDHTVITPHMRSRRRVAGVATPTASAQMKGSATAKRPQTQTIA